MPVAELQEGLKTAIAEGEILDKEITTLRDGRLVVTYNLTDFTDSILVKAFGTSPRKTPSTSAIESGSRAVSVMIPLCVK